MSDVEPSVPAASLSRNALVPDRAIGDRAGPFLNLGQKLRRPSVRGACLFDVDGKPRLDLVDRPVNVRRRHRRQLTDHGEIDREALDIAKPLDGVHTVRHHAAVAPDQAVGLAIVAEQHGRKRRRGK